MKLILKRAEMSKLNKEFLECPLEQAVVQRGLPMLAREWIIAESENKKTNPSVAEPSEPKGPSTTDKTDPRRAEQFGDFLLEKAYYWDGNGQADLYRPLSTDAKPKFLEAIVA
jgi:hypothetical protein